MATKYLDAVRQGRNKWWQYAAGMTIPFFVVIFICLVLMLCLQIFGYVNFSDFKNKILISKIISSAPLWIFYLASIFIFSAVYFSFLVGVEKLHHRNYLSILCPDRKFKIGRYLTALVIYFLLSLFFNLFQYIFNPQIFQTLRFAFDPIQWLIYLVPTVITAVVSALARETIRGYVLQGLGLIVRQTFSLIFISGFLSSVISLTFNRNSSIQPQSMIFDFALGIGLAMFILKENGLELVLGVQTAGSLIPRFISYQLPEDLPLSLPSILIININTQIYPSLVSIGAVLLLIKFTIFYAILLREPILD
jgi:uncharacterized protein